MKKTDYHNGQPADELIIMNEFPEITEAIRKGEDVDSLTEDKGRKKKSELEKEVEERLTENFERKLKDALVEIREEIQSEIKEELESDPEVAGAKGVLAAIADMVSVYRGEVDEKAARDAVKASDLAVSEANRERDEAQELAKETAHALYIEKKIAKHPMADSIRKLLKGKTIK